MGKKNTAKSATTSQNNMRYLSISTSSFFPLALRRHFT